MKSVSEKLEQPLAMAGILTTALSDAKMRRPSGRSAGDRTPEQNWIRWATIVVGSVSYIFATSIVTSKTVSIYDLSLWVLGSIVPGLIVGLHYVAEKRSPHRGVSNFELVGLAGWSASMMAFVILRVYFLSDYFERGIYDSSDPNLARYILLSAIYTLIGYSFALLLLFVAGRRPLRDRNLLFAVPVEFAGSAIFFCLMVFYVPYLLRL